MQKRANFQLFFYCHLLVIILSFTVIYCHLLSFIVIILSSKISQYYDSKKRKARWRLYTILRIDTFACAQGFSLKPKVQMCLNLLFFVIQKPAICVSCIRYKKNNVEGMQKKCRRNVEIYFYVEGMQKKCRTLFFMQKKCRRNVELYFLCRRNVEGMQKYKY